MTERAVRVGAVPAGHPFARHVLPLPEDPATVVHLPDPIPAGRPAGQWWPPALLDADWVAAHAGELDLVHVHFGLESLAPGALAAAVAALRRAGRPLVYTAHDLTNPQLADQARHLDDLALMMEAADRVLTLTPAAAAVIHERWGRTAQVVEHPHVVPLDETVPGVERAPGEPLTVGVHLRDLRPNLDAVPAVTTLLAAVDELARQGTPARVVVQLNERVRDPAAAETLEGLLRDHPSARLQRGGRLSDAELAASLLALDVTVLPYRFGTHSGWVELCWDLGLPVVAPAGVGFYAEQHPLEEYAAGDPGSLALALLTSAGDLTDVRRERDDLRERRRHARREQRRRIAAAHHRVYAHLLTEGPPGSPGSPDQPGWAG